MSSLARPRNHIPRSRAAITAATLITWLLATTAPPANATTAQPAKTAAARPANAATSTTPPVAAERPGYWAYATCSDNGEPASGEGWITDDLGGYPLLDGQLESCGTPGGTLGLRDEGAKDSTPGSGPMLAFEGIPLSYLAGGEVSLTMSSPGGEAFLETPNEKAGSEDVLASCNESCTGVRSQTVTIPDTEGWLLSAAALCRPPADQDACSTSAVNAELTILSATILFRNQAEPQASSLEGSLTEPNVAGTANLSFLAHDEAGPGIYRASVLLDGQEFLSLTPNTEHGSCVAYGTFQEALKFRAEQPCPQETPVRIELPTSGIPDGKHLLEVQLEDAAGNKSVILDRMLTIENHPGANDTPEPPSKNAGATAPSSTAEQPSASSSAAPGPPNGTGASENAQLTATWANSGKRVLRSRYQQPVTITGHLANSTGNPITDATLQASSTASSPGARTAAITPIHTDAHGKFALHLRAASSSKVRLEYRSHLGDSAPAASTTLTLAVPASLHLTVTPHRTQAGHRITLHGKLAGAIPPGGKQVILEAHATGEPWLEFHSATTNANGEFTVRHRFRLPGPENYTFRAVCRHEAAFPFQEGTSNTARVHER